MIRISGLFQVLSGPCVCRCPEVGLSSLSSQRQNLSSLEKGINSTLWQNDLCPWIVGGNKKIKNLNLSHQMHLRKKVKKIRKQNKAQQNTNPSHNEWVSIFNRCVLKCVVMQYVYKRLKHK